LRRCRRRYAHVRRGRRHDPRRRSGDGLRRHGLRRCSGRGRARRSGRRGSRRTRRSGRRGRRCRSGRRRGRWRTRRRSRGLSGRGCGHHDARTEPDEQARRERQGAGKAPHWPAHHHECDHASTCGARQLTTLFRSTPTPFQRHEHVYAPNRSRVPSDCTRTSSMTRGSNRYYSVFR
jgi:hypothetical protein